MVKNRTILNITLGYIIGIIWGLYFNISIVSLYILIYFIDKIFSKIFIYRKIKRYIKLQIDFKSIIIFIIISIISSTIIYVQNNKFEKSYQNISEVNAYAKVVSDKAQKEYKKVYKIKIYQINSQNKFKNTYVYLETKKEELQKDDFIYINGNFENPSENTNYKGFNYKEYLKTKKIYGIIKAKEIKIIKQSKSNLLDTIKQKSQSILEANFNKKENSILKGILLGNSNDIAEEVKEDFSNSSISHILAISGMHISYIVLIVSFVCDKICGKHFGKYITIFVILIYVIITGASPSSVRAGIMGALIIGSKIVYRKNDIWTSMAISILIMLIYNPFLIKNTSVIFSYSATIGIILLNKNVFELLQKIKIKKSKRLIRRKENEKLKEIVTGIYKIISVSISAQIFIIPIIAVFYNKISLTFIFINFIVSFIIGPIVIFGIIFLISSIFNLYFSQIVKIILEVLVRVLLKISEVGAQLPLSKIYVATPRAWQILVYYIEVLTVNFVISAFLKKEKRAFDIRIKNIYFLIKYKFKCNTKKIVGVICVIVILFSAIKNRNLKIYFVDVGQGDCTLVVTPQNKKILIDGGGSENYDVGKNTLLPYLLDRKITKIDYMIISHFDTDHCKGLLYVMQELNVKNVIIGRQFEKNENLEEFIRIVNKKKINVSVMHEGDKLKIEKDIFLNVLWPSNKEEITENSINNNSLVFKLKYKNFNILFTGDIEKETEEVIIDKYNTDLQSTILKVAHHGSKSSSTSNFIEKVKPKIAIIEVGKNNLYGHPSEDVIKTLKYYGSRIYRTDEDGEVIFEVDKWGRIKSN